VGKCALSDGWAVLQSQGRVAYRVYGFGVAHVHDVVDGRGSVENRAPRQYRRVSRNCMYQDSHSKGFVESRAPRQYRRVDCMYRRWEGSYNKGFEESRTG
jgi:hypothetical protein